MNVYIFILIGAYLFTCLTVRYCVYWLESAYFTVRYWLVSACFTVRYWFVVSVPTCLEVYHLRMIQTNICYVYRNVWSSTDSLLPPNHWWWIQWAGWKVSEVFF